MICENAKNGNQEGVTVMSKKWKIIMAVISGVVVLSLAGGAIALADEGQATASNPYLAAVAAKLGVTEQALVDAMRQARQQLAGARRDLNKARYDMITASFRIRAAAGVISDTDIGALAAGFSGGEAD